jgi:hypothetical protein
MSCEPDQDLLREVYGLSRRRPLELPPVDKWWEKPAVKPDLTFKERPPLGLQEKRREITKEDTKATYECVLGDK